MPATAPPSDARASAATPAGASPEARWHVRLLGAVQAHAAGAAIERWPSRAVAALLARLALQPGREHPREELVELLWPGVALDVGRNRLRQALSTLKSLLEPPGLGPAQPVLAADRLSVRVLPGGLACDATRFEHALRSGRHDVARALYQGELMPGYYDEWIVDERQRLSALHDRLPAAPAAPAAFPQGAAHGSAPAGMPGPAAAALAASALSGHRDPGSRDPGPRVLLPTYLTRLFGADEQAARLRGLVLAHRLVTVLGPGGCGKTRLAVETAHALRDPAPWDPGASPGAPPFDLIAFVPLLACTTRAQCLDALADALRLRAAGDEPLRLLQQALQGRRALLVLDNLEQLDDEGRALVAELTGALPLLHALATSRRALGLDGEREFAIAPLPLPMLPPSLPSALPQSLARSSSASLSPSLPASPAPSLPQSLQHALPPSPSATEGPPAEDATAANPAVALFVERARAVRSDFHAGPRNIATLAALVRALEGMPLAIELAAARMRSIPPADMLARLAAGGAPQMELLARSGPRAAMDPRHASMQRAIEWSWRLLTPEQARLLGALTVFGVDFGAEAARAIVRGEPCDADLVLDDLVAHSLVHRRDDTTGGARAEAAAALPPRFGLYQPIREYAVLQLSEEEARHWRARLRAWALAWAQALPRTPPLDALRTEMPNLVRALATAAADGAPHDAVALLAALRRSLEDVELPGAGLDHTQAALAACDDVALRARGSALLAPLCYVAGRAADAQRHGEQGVAGPLAGAERGRALHALARVRWRARRRPEEVLPLLDEAQALAEAHGDDELRASLLALRAFVANHQRDHGRAEVLHAQALACWERLGNQHAIDSGRYNLAACAQGAGRHAQALERLGPVIASARGQHDWRRLSQSLNVRGNAYSGLRRWPEAVADYRECLRVAWTSMAGYDLAYGLWNLPRALAHLRRPQAALKLAAYAALYWRTHYGELSASDERYLLRVRRLAARQLDAAGCKACWAEGEGMTLAAAMRVAQEG